MPNGCSRGTSTRARRQLDLGELGRLGQREHFDLVPLVEDRPAPRRQGRRLVAELPQTALQPIDFGIAVVQEAIEIEALAGVREVAQREMGLDQQLVGDELGGVLTDRPFEPVLRPRGLAHLEQAAAHRDLGRQVRGVPGEPFVEGRHRLGEPAGTPILLGELQEESRVGIALPALLELGQALRGDGLRQAAPLLQRAPDARRRRVVKPWIDEV